MFCFDLFYFFKKDYSTSPSLLAGGTQGTGQNTSPFVTSSGSASEWQPLREGKSGQVNSGSAWVLPVPEKKKKHKSTPNSPEKFSSVLVSQPSRWKLKVFVYLPSIYLNLRKYKSRGAPKVGNNKGREGWETQFPSSGYSLAQERSWKSPQSSTAASCLVVGGNAQNATSG